MAVAPKHPKPDDAKHSQRIAKRTGAANVDKVGANRDANEGEGNRTAARAYNTATQAFVASGKVPKAAKDAARAFGGPEGAELRRAEEEGKRHGHGEDPALRKQSKP